jgi:hypothetical protein
MAAPMAVWLGGCWVGMKVALRAAQWGLHKTAPIRRECHSMCHYESRWKDKCHSSYTCNNMGRLIVSRKSDKKQQEEVQSVNVGMLVVVVMIVATTKSSKPTYDQIKTFLL